MLHIINVIPKPFSDIEVCTLSSSSQTLGVDCLLTLKGQTETPVERAEVDFLLSIEEESFKCCISDGDRFRGLSDLAQLFAL